MKKELIKEKIEKKNSSIAELDKSVRNAGGVVKQVFEKKHYKQPKRELDKLTKMERSYKAQLKRLKNK